MREPIVLLGLLDGITRLFAAHAARQVDLVHRHGRRQALVLDAERGGECMQRRLDEVRHRELRQRAAHRHIRRHENQPRPLEQRHLARDAEVMGQVRLDQRIEAGRVEVVLALHTEQRARDRRERGRDHGSRRVTRIEGLVHLRFEVVADRHVHHAIVAERATHRVLDRLAGLGRAGQGDDAADVAFGEEQPRHGGERLGHVFADQPDRLAFHAAHALGLRAAEQLAFGDRAFLVQAAGWFEGLARDRAVRHEEHGGERDVGFGRHAIQVQHAEHAITNLLGFLRDARGVDERLRWLRQFEHPLLGARMRLLVEDHAAVAQSRNQARGHRARHDEVQRRMRRLLVAVRFALDLRGDLPQRLRHAVALQQAEIVVGERHQDVAEQHAGFERLQHRTVYLVEALVLEDQLRAPIEEAGLAVLALQPLALDGTRRDRIDLDLRADETREVLDQRALARLRDGIVRAVRVGHGDVLLPAEIRADVQDVAGTLCLHHRHDFLDQRVVRDEVRVQRIAPIRGMQIHGHLLGTRDAGVVDQVIDAAEGLDGRRHGLGEAGFIGHVDVREHLHAVTRPVVADLLELGDDALAQLDELVLAPRRQHHAGAGDREQARELAADAGRAAGDQHALAEMQAHQRFDPAEVRPRRPGGIDDRRRHVQAHLRHAAFRVQQACGLAGRKQQAVLFRVRPAQDLVGPFDRGPVAGLGLRLAFVAPDTHELLDAGAQDVCIGVACSVTAIRHEQRAWIAALRGELVPDAGQLARDADRTRELCAEERIHVRIARFGEGGLETPGTERGQHDRTVQAMARLQATEQRGEGVGATPVEQHGVDPRVRAILRQCCHGGIDGLFGAQAQQHVSAALRLRARDDQRIGHLITGRHENGRARAIDGAQFRT